MKVSTYGLTKLDLEIVNKKHEVQRSYLDNHFFNTQQGQVKTLLDVSFSANHSKRYYSELINKINEINHIVTSETVEYQPVFITVTLDGFFRDFLKGNFKRYNPIKHKKLIPNNERFGKLKDKIENQEKFTIRDLYKTLNFQFNRFQNSKPYQNIKKQGFNIHFIKVFEPHKKDGVPHFHMMLYIPKQFLFTLLKTYKEYFPTKQNTKPLKDCNEGQVNGFQWKIDSAPAYILKYIFKSFIDVDNESELDYLQAWYIKHKIYRCTTSHTLIPAWVYRKIIPLEKDWFYLTDIKNNGYAEWSKEDNYFKFEDTDTNRVYEYDNGIYRHFKNDRLIQEFGEKKEVVELVNHTLEQIKLKRKDFNSRSNYIPIDNQLIKKIVPITKRDTYELYTQYKKMNHSSITSFDTNEYILIQNELSKRNYIDSPIVSLNTNLNI